MKLKSDSITIILGDFNAKIGQGQRTDIVGNFGLGSSNERGDRLHEFFQGSGMIITNTFFDLPKRRLYTWQAPRSDLNNSTPIRNQIDYLLINRRFKNIIKNAKTYPGADIGSDHNPLVTELSLNLKAKRQTHPARAVDVTRLNDPEVRHIVAEEINNRLTSLQENQLRDIETLWNSIKNIIVDTCKLHLRETFKPKNKWMTDHILTLMEQRRLAKNKPDKYKKIQKIIRREIKEAKQRWMEGECAEIEDLCSKHDTFNMYRKVKEIAGVHRKRTTMSLTNDRNRLILEEQELKNTWTSYIEANFEDHRADAVYVHEGTGPTILKSEVIHAFSIAKNRKASGPDEIPTEALKLITEENIGLVVKLFNSIYETGEIPSDWLSSTFIALPKKQQPKKCGDYRLISLMSHMLKAFLRIIHARIRRRCEEDLDDSQFGFRNAFGTREALFGMNLLLQKCRDQRKDVFACFIDYEKAFDRIQHDKLIDILQGVGIDDRDIRIIKNLYWNQTAQIKIGNIKTDHIRIQRGVRQGCILSPLLFNLYSDRIFKEALEGISHLGIKINGEPITTIRYADDTVILANTFEGLQLLINKIGDVGETQGLKINIGKTKFMIFSRQPHNGTTLELNGSQIERVSKFKYLGSIITEDLNPDCEIKCRIEIARATFNNMRSFLCNDNLNLKLRQRMVECYVWSVLLYGVETWTLKVRTMNQLEAFEMWLHRRMLRIPWTQHVTNENVLRRANIERQLLTTVKCRKTSYLGHILRGDKYRLLQLILKGKIEGRRGIGRKQQSWLRNIRDWTGIRRAGELFRLAEDRTAFAMVIANVRETGQGT